MQKRPSVLRLTKAPLVLTLCQIKFESVLDLSDRIRTVQSKVKALGFPRYDVSKVTNITIQTGQPQVQLSEQWIFTNARRTTSVALTTEQITVVSSSYERFETFAEPLLQIWEVLRASGVELFKRIGLRYVDLIQPEASEDISQYVHGSVLGLQANQLGSDFKRVGFASETRFRSDQSVLVVRLRQLPQGKFLPPDLQVPTLVFPPQLNEHGSAYALDCDHFNDRFADTSADASAVERVLWELHAGTDAAFRAVTSDYAGTKWGPEEVLA